MNFFLEGESLTLKKNSSGTQVKHACYNNNTATIGMNSNIHYCTKEILPLLFIFSTKARSFSCVSLLFKDFALFPNVIFCRH